MVFLVRGTGTVFFSSIWDVRDVLWSFSSGQFHQIPYVNTLIKLNHIPKPTVKGKFSSPSRAEGDRSQLSPTCFEISNMVGSFKEDTVSPKQFLSGDWATHQKHITQSKWVHLLQTFGVKIMLATIWNNHPKRFLALPRSTSKFVPEIAGEFLAATKERSKKSWIDSAVAFRGGRISKSITKSWVFPTRVLWRSLRAEASKQKVKSK